MKTLVNSKLHALGFLLGLLAIAIALDAHRALERSFGQLFERARRDEMTKLLACLDDAFSP